MAGGFGFHCSRCFNLAGDRGGFRGRLRVGVLGLFPVRWPARRDVLALAKPEIGGNPAFPAALMTIEERAKRIFAERAAYYTTSKVHARPF
jgi:hypothetical protein